MKVTIGRLPKKAFAQYRHSILGSKIVLTTRKGHTSQSATDGTQYLAKLVLGIDHEWTHHILYQLEGEGACRGLDHLARTLHNHQEFTGCTPHTQFSYYRQRPRIARA